MFTVQVLGSGCTKCTKTAEKITAYTQAKNISATVVKETSAEVIMQYGVMRTPAVIIDEKLVHSGGIPTTEQLDEWFQ
jgi:hypothetical protein